MEQDNKNKKGQLNIEINDQTAEGLYSNLAIITHSASEFIIDFAQIMPGIPQARIKTRIVLAPQHAKKLLHALKDNIQKFEEKNGTIREQKAEMYPLSFGGPTAEA